MLAYCTTDAGTGKPSPLDMLLSANHHEATLGQRTITRWTDVESFFFSIVQLRSIEVQVANAASSGITLASDTSIPLE
jgi:hypothetical protein